MAVAAQHRTYNNTLYNNLYYIQTCGGKTRTEVSDTWFPVRAKRDQYKGRRGLKKLDCQWSGGGKEEY